MIVKSLVKRGESNCLIPIERRAISIVTRRVRLIINLVGAPFAIYRLRCTVYIMPYPATTDRAAIIAAAKAAGPAQVKHARAA
jgi:hypothetical protein